MDPTDDALDCQEFAPCKEYTIDGLEMEFVYIEPGTFMMGAEADEQGSGSAEKPKHEVTLTNGFYLGKYEVTKGQWEAVMGTTPWAGRSYVIDDPDSPAVYVSWHDAREFIEEFKKREQGTFRLPTEAEWEYACRAGASTRFYWGDDPEYAAIGTYAWYAGNTWQASEKYAHVVGQKLPNSWGLYDMSGNVWEWCADRWGDYPADPVTDPLGPQTGSYRVLRGGGWYYNARNCRCANRFRYYPDHTNNNHGFRVALAPGE